VVDGIEYTRKELWDAFGKAVSKGDIAKCKSLMPEKFDYPAI
jgi:hypothetical protein